uniref:Ovule protein n=1 Tax=Schistosoma curassoni TaxID=6186 RepID=A0A183KKY7_9TREM
LIKGLYIYDGSKRNVPREKVNLPNWWTIFVTDGCLSSIKRYLTICNFSLASSASNQLGCLKSTKYSVLSSLFNKLSMKAT